PTSLPFQQTQVAFFESVTAETIYSLSSDGLSIGFNHVRLERSSAESLGSIYFEVDQDAGYSLSGQYTLGGSRDISFGVNLYDLTVGQALFLNAQESLLTTNQSFLLGRTAGDFQNGLSGSMNGSLTAGHTYRLIYDASVDTSKPAIRGRVKTGHVEAFARARGSFTASGSPLASSESSRAWSASSWGRT